MSTINRSEETMISTLASMIEKHSITLEQAKEFLGTYLPWDNYNNSKYRDMADKLDNLVGGVGK